MGEAGRGRTGGNEHDNRWNDGEVEGGEERELKSSGTSLRARVVKNAFFKVIAAPVCRT